MTLLDLISVIDENTNVFVWAHDEADPGQDILVSTYDGKDSIDPIYNDELVESVSSAAGEAIDIVLQCKVSKDAMVDVYESTVTSAEEIDDDYADDLDIEPVVFLIMYDPDTDDFVATEDVDAIHVDTLNDVLTSIRRWADETGEEYTIKDNIDYSKADVKGEWEDYGTVTVNFAYSM